MTTFATGRQAEAVAAAYLEGRQYRILDQNWRTRYCEIDVIAHKDQTVYFVEVKYRANSQQGTGLDYITPQKLRRMSFAAQMWVANRGWRGDYQLAVAAVTGRQPAVSDFIVLD